MYMPFVLREFFHWHLLLTWTVIKGLAGQEAIDALKKATSEKDDSASYVELWQDVYKSPLYQFIIFNIKTIAENPITAPYVLYDKKRQKHSLGNTLFQKANNLNSIISEIKKGQYDKDAQPLRMNMFDTFESIDGQTVKEHKTNIANLQTPYTGITSRQVLLDINKKQQQSNNINTEQDDVDNG